MSSSVSFIIPVQEDVKSVEALIRRQAYGWHADLQAALDHLLSSGGKRVRPSLTLLMGRLLGADPDRLITLASSIELLHTATLVHDDLIDGALLRRGIPTLNSSWSPAATVLTGDFLFACAAKLASDTNSIPVMDIFSRTLITIVNGEIAQLFASRCRVSREDYLRRIYAKTASLFETAAATAAMISPVGDETIAICARFGYELGMAFQIIDDILDFTGDQASLGKPIGSDLRQGLITLPALIYIENNPEDEDCRHLLAGNCPENDAQIQRLIYSIVHSNAIELAYEEASQAIRRAEQSLEHLPVGPERDSLREMAAYFVSRKL